MNPAWNIWENSLSLHTTVEKMIRLQRLIIQLNHLKWEIDNYVRKESKVNEAINRVDYFGLFDMECFSLIRDCEKDHTLQYIRNMNKVKNLLNINIYALMQKASATEMAIKLI